MFELDAPQPDGRTLNDCVEQFRRGSTDAKREALRYIGNFLNVSDPVVNDVCNEAMRDPEIRVRLAAMYSIVGKRFRKTEDSRIAREYATIALDPTNDDQLRTAAALVVYDIFTLDRSGSGEYYPKLIRLLRDKVAGIDYDLMNWVIEIPGMSIS